MEYLKKNIEDAQNNVANRLAEKLQAVSEDIFNPDDNEVKIYN